MFKRLVQVRTFPEAGHIRSLLVKNGFHPPEVDASAHVTVAGADQVYYVELPDDEVHAALQFLRDAGRDQLIVAAQSRQKGPMSPQEFSVRTLPFSPTSSTQ